VDCIYQQSIDLIDVYPEMFSIGKKVGAEQIHLIFTTKNQKHSFQRLILGSIAIWTRISDARVLCSIPSSVGIRINFQMIF
jgi:hypothetical protein